ncbi:MAG: hypothetical protein ACRDRS_08450 [Pseudonocardiaceae bacterium]
MRGTEDQSLDSCIMSWDDFLAVCPQNNQLTIVVPGEDGAVGMNRDCIGFDSAEVDVFDKTACGE